MTGMSPVSNSNMVENNGFWQKINSPLGFAGPVNFRKANFSTYGIPVGDFETANTNLIPNAKVNRNNKANLKQGDNFKTSGSIVSCSAFQLHDSLGFIIIIIKILENS